MTLHCDKTGRHWPCITAGNDRIQQYQFSLYCPAAMRARQQEADHD